MIVVAISAIAIKAPSEYRNWFECSRLAKASAFFQEQANLNDQERNYCLKKNGRESYNREGRYQYLTDNSFFHECLRFSFDSWLAEAEWHQGESHGRRCLAKEYASRRENLRSRMLIPWLATPLGR
jgi:hypothetical protein